MLYFASRESVQAPDFEEVFPGLGARRNRFTFLEESRLASWLPLWRELDPHLQDRRGAMRHSPLLSELLLGLYWRQATIRDRGEA